MKYFLTITLILITLILNAQDFSFGKITAKDFEKNNYDSIADAVVLREYGKASIEFNSIKGDLVLRNYYHTRILILNSNGSEHANFSIPLYKSNNSNRETLENIKGATFYISNNKISQTELEKKNILTDKQSESREVVKIALPNAKEGTIIELRYTIESPYLYNLTTWKFQDFIPKIYSEFVTQIPEICTYNVNMKGPRNLTRRKQNSYDTKIVTSVGDVSGMETTYIMENIPAFVREEYMTSATNFITTLNFELASYRIPFGPSHNFTTTWKDVEKLLHEDNRFGKELNRRNIFKDLLPNIIKSDMDKLAQARAIYKYVRNQIKWNKNYGTFAENGIRKALENKLGNIGDINIALINALREANFEAYPVILSTRENGFPSLSSPVISDFNYVVAHLKIDDKVYLLDASDKYLNFGLLPHRCINFRGRLILPNQSDWIDLVCNYSNRTNYTFNGELSEDGNLTGNLTIGRNGYAAVNKRNEITTFNSLEEYFEKFIENNNHLKIKTNKIENIDDSEYLLLEQYEIEAKNFGHTNSSVISFNPFFIGRTAKNPFNLDERSYPVDLGSTIEEIFEFNIKLPKSYKLHDRPKNINAALPNRDGRFLYIIKEEDNVLSIQALSSVNKPLFLPEEYLDLKEFFSHIINSQKIDLKIKKEDI